MEQRVQPAVAVAVPGDAVLLLRRPKRAARRWRLVLWAGLLALAYAAGSQLKGPLAHFFHAGDAYVYDGAELMTPSADSDGEEQDPRAKSINPRRSSFP